jgi:hypothetical protein
MLNRASFGAVYPGVPSFESLSAEVTDSGQPIPSLLAEEFGLPFILSFLDGFGPIMGEKILETKATRGYK